MLSSKMNKTEKLHLHFIEKRNEYIELVINELQQIVDGTSSFYFHRLHDQERYGIRTGNKYVSKECLNLESRENELDSLSNKLGDYSYKEIERIIEEFIDKVYKVKHRYDGLEVHVAKEIIQKLKTIKEHKN